MSRPRAPWRERIVEYRRSGYPLRDFWAYLTRLVVGHYNVGNNPSVRHK